MNLAIMENPTNLVSAPPPRLLTGAQTVTAAMAALQERSGSSVVVLGYTPAYPISNILLTTWGSVVVVVFAG
jgi:putative transport protein